MKEVKNIAKELLVYQYIYMTNNKTKIARQARTKYRVILSKILTNQESLYKEARALQKEIYTKAWNECFEERESGYYLSLGTFMSLIWNSIEEKPLVGRAFMDKLFMSYEHCHNDKCDDYEIESNSTMLAEACLRLIDGDKGVSPFQRRMNIIRNNRIIEGKNI